jgi:hypothetical protein
MNLLSIKLLGATAVAGLVAVGGSAFTASGVTGPAIGSQAIGVGSVSQSVTGATLSTVHYNTTGEDVNSIDLVFADALQLGSDVDLGIYTDAGVTAFPSAAVVCVDGNADLTTYSCTVTKNADSVTSTSLKQITVTVS